MRLCMPGVRKGLEMGNESAILTKTLDRVYFFREGPRKPKSYRDSKIVDGKPVFYNVNISLYSSIPHVIYSVLPLSFSSARIQDYLCAAVLRPNAFTMRRGEAEEEGSLPGRQRES